MPIAGQSNEGAGALSPAPQSVTSGSSGKFSLSSLLPGFANGVLGWLSSMYQNSQTRKNMDYQAKINLDQWNRENAYNSPAAQMQRFVQAGLNPDLIYGQSNTSGTGNISTEAPSGSRPNIDNSVQSVLNTMMLRSQIALNESAAAKNYADAGIKPQQGEFYSSGAEKNREQAKLFSAETNVQIAAQSKVLADTEYIKAKTTKEIIETHHLMEMHEKQMDLISSEIGLNEAQTNNLKAKTREIIEKLPYELEYLRSATNKNDALASYYSRVRETLYQDIWDALAYKSGVQFDENGDASFATEGAKYMSTATQGAERGTKLVKDIVSMIMQFASKGISPEMVHETVSTTTGPNGKTTTHTYSHDRPPIRR